MNRTITEHLCGSWKTLLSSILLLATVSALADAPLASATDTGKAVYRFYCYQCHGYSGDAKTLASTYLSPKPRDFTSHTAASLPRERMLLAVRDGRPDTAMVGFSSVINDEQISAVVDYIRSSLLGNANASEKYHSPENGWTNHEKYNSAFPFIDGTIALDAPWEELGPTQRAGRELYLSACISCHDQPNTASGELVWETRAVSFPRDHFSHRSPPLDAISGASPYARHDVPTIPGAMTALEKRGLDLYQINCAFCHAPDGTGQNWIGSFLEPRPRDFTASDFALIDAPVALREIIKSGIPDSSMPAWRHVLNDDDIDAIIAYMKRAFRTN